MKLSGFLAAAVLLAVPTAALAAPGLVTTPVSMRAGPGPGFPTVDRLRHNAYCIELEGPSGRSPKVAPPPSKSKLANGQKTAHS